MQREDYTLAITDVFYAGVLANDDDGNPLVPTSLSTFADGDNQGAIANGKSVTVTKKPACLLYTSPSPRDRQKSRMPSSA